MMLLGSFDIKISHMWFKTIMSIFINDIMLIICK